MGGRKEKKLLLTRPFKPYGIVNEYNGEGSSVDFFDNICLDPVKRFFAPKSVFLTYALYLIGENLSTPTTILDFPTLEEFEKELEENYDYIGISFKAPQFEKVKKMVEIIRSKSPKTKIILGGYGTVLSGLSEHADYICKGEGIGFMRRILDEQIDAPIKHPLIYYTGNILGYTYKTGVIIAGFGCPWGCDFCQTSYFFNRKHIPFLKTGREIYNVILRMGDKLKPRRDYIIYEEDFLLYRNRVYELAELIKEERLNPVTLQIFATCDSLSQYDPESLVKMGIETIWVGVDSVKIRYAKSIKDKKVKELFKNLHNSGIQTIASLIIGYPDQTKEDIKNEIDFLISLEPTAIQFAVLTPGPGTPIFEDFIGKGMISSPSIKDLSGRSLAFNHSNISSEEIKKMLYKAYEKEFNTLGTLLIRFLERQIIFYHKYKNDPLLARRIEQIYSFLDKSVPIILLLEKYEPSYVLMEKAKGLRLQIDNNGIFKIRNILLKSILNVKLKKYIKRNKVNGEVLIFEPPTLKYNSMKNKRINDFEYYYPDKGVDISVTVKDFS